MHNLLLGNGVTGHLYIRRIPMADVPSGEEEATKWMHELYQRKVRVSQNQPACSLINFQINLQDRMQDSFYKTGDFFKESGIPRVEPFRLPRRKVSLISWCFWFVVTLVPMSYWLACLLTSGSTIKFSIGASIIASCKLLSPNCSFKILDRIIAVSI
jgi:lysophosphatidic acid acyltransferase / lysophosphatidylinositol acyltransferase